jgi:putative ABC transport system ATP-binding protein
MDVLEEINQQNKTVITVTHDPEIAQRAHRILQITDGKVREYNA